MTSIQQLTLSVYHDGLINGKLLWYKMETTCMHEMSFAPLFHAVKLSYSTVPMHDISIFGKKELSFPQLSTHVLKNKNVACI